MDLKPYKGARFTLGDARRRVGLIAFLTVFLIVGACSPTEVQVDDGEVVFGTDPQGRCENEARVLEGTSPTPAPGIGEGDLDGDGAADRVHIAGDPDGPPGCAAFLVAATSSVTYSTPLDPSGAPRSLLEPSVLGFTDVDGRAGDEVLVTIEAGASTQFVGVFTLTPRGLERMTLTGKGPGPFAADSTHADLFPYGGSVGHLEAVDCARDGGVVMSAATPAGSSAEKYRVERRFFRARGTTLVLDRGATESTLVDGLEVDRFPEFKGSPFLSCD